MGVDAVAEMRVELALRLVTSGMPEDEAARVAADAEVILEEGEPVGLFVAESA